MGERDDLYKLGAMIEADGGNFTIEASKQNQETQKTGKVSMTKSNVIAMAESTVLEPMV
jgi:hypothetical protein